jgi:L-rhamnose mutarotase
MIQAVSDVNTPQERSGPIRKAFRMKVYAGQEAEYERRHRPIWVELEEVLRAHGVTRYSIFLDPAKQDLFAYAEIEDEQRWNAIAETEVCRRWWRHMREIMPSSADDSPLSSELKEVFRL